MIEALIAGETNPPKLAAIGGPPDQGLAQSSFTRCAARPVDRSSPIPAAASPSALDFAASAIEQIDRQVEASIARIDEAAACGQAPFHCLIGLL